MNEINGLLSQYRDFSVRNAFAKNNGILEYRNNCPQHGETDHCAGRCVICDPRHAARKRETATYVAQCATHGETTFALQTGKCLTCYTAAGVVRRGKTARAIARAAGARTYRGRCETHGETEFGVQSGKCLTCFNSLGYVRSSAPRGDPLRTEARRNGEPTYPGWCAVHGAVPHSTSRGKCLTCFNAMGYPRP